MTTLDEHEGGGIGDDDGGLAGVLDGGGKGGWQRALDPQDPSRWTAKR